MAGQKLSPLSRDSVLDFFEDNNDRIIEESKGLIYYLGNGQSYVPGVRMYISEQDVDDFFDEPSGLMFMRFKMIKGFQM